MDFNEDYITLDRVMKFQRSWHSGSLSVDEVLDAYNSGRQTLIDCYYNNQCRGTEEMMNEIEREFGE